MPEPLTREDRELAIELALSHYEGRWIEEQIRAAATMEAAIETARETCSWMGYVDERCHIRGEMAVPPRARTGSGIYVEAAGGRRAGWITWREIAEYAREPRQMALPL